MFVLTIGECSTQPYRTVATTLTYIFSVNLLVASVVDQCVQMCMECAKHPRVVPPPYPQHFLKKNKSMKFDGCWYFKITVQVAHVLKKVLRKVHMLHYNTDVSVPLIQDALQSHGNIQRYF